MYGIYIDHNRPKSKKAIKDLLVNGDLGRISLEATSLFGNEYEGPLCDAPNGTYTYVGPDPYTSRKFYGNIVISNGKVKVS